jgi:hypothetical protein
VAPAVTPNPETVMAAAMQKAGEKAGTPLSQPVKTVQPEKVLTSAKKETAKPAPMAEFKPEPEKPVATLTGEGLKQFIAETKPEPEVKSAAVSAETFEAQAKDVTPGQASATGDLFRTKTIQGKQFPVFKTKVLERFAKMAEDFKRWGALKPDEDSRQLTKLETDVVLASIKHMEKAIIGMAENLSPESYALVMGKSKIIDIHWMTNIERLRDVIRKHGTGSSARLTSQTILGKVVNS